MRLDLQPASLVSMERLGWSEDRHVDVSQVTQSLRSAGYAIDQYMTEVLASLHGLTVVPLVEQGSNFRNDEPLLVDPLGVGVRHRREAAELEEWFRVKFCPLGWWLTGSHVYFSAEGLVVASAPGVVWEMGSDLASAIEFVLLANKPLVRLWSMDQLDF